MSGVPTAIKSKRDNGVKLPNIKPNAPINGNFNMLENMDENINQIGLDDGDDVIAPINVRRRN